MAGTATPIDTPNSGNFWLEGILWGKQWDSGAVGNAPTEINYYIGGLRGSETIALDHDTVTSTLPYTAEIEAMTGAMRAISDVANVKFSFVGSQAAADVIWASVNDTDADGALGWANPPGTEFSTQYNDFQSLIVSNYEAYSPADPDPDLLKPGGFDYITFIHEFGHAMGLAHPHDTGGGSTVFPGVSGPFDDYGDFNMNQGVFTMMSYNDGWKTAPQGDTTDPRFGFEARPMALDVAALQFMYGANNSYHAGNDTYALAADDQVGTNYVCLWDAGGADQIVGGNSGNTIDLRAATLAAATGGGGWVSSATGVHGGFTIANGVVIENATGGSGVDSIRGNSAANVLLGFAGADILVGDSGNDTLDGGSDADKMTGGKNDDTYLVDSAGDVIVEVAGEGTADRVKASISYVLAASANIELLTTDLSTGTTVINLTGNALKQEILGNDTSNIIKDGPSGGAGDLLRGLSGSDTYQIFSSASKIQESSTHGSADKVIAAVDFVLGSGVYVEVMQTVSAAATTGIDLTGNALKQDITGNAGANELSDGGKGVADVLRGLGGNDTYRIFNTGDTIVESATSGTADKIIAAASYALGTGVYVEIMQTSSGAGTTAINLYGNEIAQSITGNNGANRIEGKGGADTLRGLGGADSFVFATKLGGGNTDTILDFNPSDDRFQLSDMIFTKLTPGTITADQFRANTTGEARDSTDRIIYDTDSGGVFYDVDGLGGTAGMRFATLSTGLAITNADFVVV